MAGAACGLAVHSCNAELELNDPAIWKEGDAWLLLLGSTSGRRPTAGRQRRQEGVILVIERYMLCFFSPSICTGTIS
jgi:hypothetical protein